MNSKNEVRENIVKRIIEVINEWDEEKKNGTNNKQQ